MQECVVDICTVMRRKMGCNKIALGHHYDDCDRDDPYGNALFSAGADNDAEAA